MVVLIDTGILLRLVHKNDPLHPVVRAALRVLKKRGDDLVTASQNIAKFWNVCTRPATARGGYGLDIHETEKRLRLLERIFRVFPDGPAAFLCSFRMFEPRIAMWSQWAIVREAQRGRGFIDGVLWGVRFFQSDRMVAHFQRLVFSASGFFDWNGGFIERLYLVAEVADRQFIAGFQEAFLHAHAIDADAIGAAQIADDKIIVDLGNTAVPAGNLARGDLDVTLLMPSDEHDWLIQKDVGAFAHGHELCGL
jgi:hypothetical protein